MADQVFLELPFAAEPGDPFSAFGRTYYLDRIDEDGIVTLRSGHTSGAGDLMVGDEDGMPRKPTVDEILVLMANGDLIHLERRPNKAQARARRQKDIDAEQARELDEVCDFRTYVVRLVEKGRREGTLSLSDNALKAPVEKAWKLFKKKRREYKRAIREEKAATGKEPIRRGNRWKRPRKKPCGATVRTWLHTRGEEGSRKVSDGVSDTGRTVRARMIDHPIEILAYHTTRALAGRAVISQRIAEYRAELTMISEGRAFARSLAEVDEDGNWRLGSSPANYPAPDTPYTAVSDGIFYDIVRTIRSKKAYAIQTSAMGAMQRYEGGGRTEVPSRIGVLGEIDDTPVPNLFLMCGVTGLPLGGATATVIIDVCSRLIPGSDLSWEKANTNTVLRTILDANRPTLIPQKMLDDLPEEGAFLSKFAPSWAMKFDRILGDNLAAYHGVAVEDACMDVGTVTEFTAKHKPMSRTSWAFCSGCSSRFCPTPAGTSRWPRSSDTIRTRRSCARFSRPGSSSRSRSSSTTAAGRHLTGPPCQPWHDGDGEAALRCDHGRTRRWLRDGRKRRHPEGPRHEDDAGQGRAAPHSRRGTSRWPVRLQRRHHCGGQADARHGCRADRAPRD